MLFSENLRTRPIAYLAPEIPALSATFVYEEMMRLVVRGYSVQAFSVFRPTNQAVEQSLLASQVKYLYEDGFISNLLQGLWYFLRLRKNRMRALDWLFHDIRDCGFLNLSTWKLVYQFFVGAKLAKELKIIRCCHLHIHFAHVPTQIGMYASAMSGVPFTIIGHANDIFARGKLLKTKAERAVKFMTISDFNLSYLTRLGLPKDKLALVRCGVSFEMQPVHIPNLIRKEVYRVGSLGRMVEKKGFDVLIRAIAKLNNRQHKFQLSIAGDGPLRGELVQLVQELGLQDSVIFEGSLPHQCVAEWMKGLDVFVLACKQDRQGDMDGIPVVLMEAMSQAVPVISTRLSGIPELVIDGKTGLLAEPNNDQDLAIKIEEIISNSDFSYRFQLQAQVHVQEEFSFETNINRLLQCMELRS